MSVSCQFWINGGAVGVEQQEVTRDKQRARKGRWWSDLLWWLSTLAVGLLTSPYELSVLYESAVRQMADGAKFAVDDYDGYDVASISTALTVADDVELFVMRGVAESHHFSGATAAAAVARGALASAAAAAARRRRCFGGRARRRRHARRRRGRGVGGGASASSSPAGRGACLAHRRATTAMLVFGGRRRRRVRRLLRLSVRGRHSSCRSSPLSPPSLHNLFLGVSLELLNQSIDFLQCIVQHPPPLSCLS
jgi:hypothetical protein